MLGSHQIWNDKILPSPFIANFIQLCSLNQHRTYASSEGPTSTGQASLAGMTVTVPKISWLRSLLSSNRTHLRNQTNCVYKVSAALSPLQTGHRHCKCTLLPCRLDEVSQWQPCYSIFIPACCIRCVCVCVCVCVYVCMCVCLTWFPMLTLPGF